MRIIPTKFRPKISIGKKLVIAFTLLSFIPLVVIGLIGIYFDIQALKKNAGDNLNYVASSIRDRAKDFLTDIDRDFHYLRTSTAFERFLENLGDESKTDNKEDYTLAVQQFLLFAQVKKIYYQLYFIDQQGNELFKIRLNEGAFSIVPDEELNTGNSRFYFLLTDSLGPGEIAFIPVELIDNKKNTIAAMSYAARMYNSQHEFLGIIVADIFAKDFFKVMEGRIYPDAKHIVAIVNNEGHYLYHSEKKKDWNKLLATRDSIDLAKEYSPEFVKMILSGQSGMYSGRDNIASFLPLFIAPDLGKESYYLFISVARKDVFGQAHRLRSVYTILLFLFLTTSVLAGVIATRQFTRPIKKLQEGAEIISNGNYNYQLQVHTNDEIEELSHQFNSMAIAIYRREEMLKENQKNLENTVMARTAELQEQKETLQALLDHIPSAILLMDEDRNILTASANIKRIMGYEPTYVEGKKFEIIMPGVKRDNRDSSGENSVHTFTENRQDDDGQHSVIEHVSVPFTLHGKKAYLEILTDITERRNFEEHLLRMERMAATGKMASVIAHEIRNSLTSVKMLLQLQQENRTGKTRDPLDVAANSIYRMEEIINNLLHYARPADYNFQLYDVNRILIEAVNLLRPQAEKRNISIKTFLEPELKEILVDPNHLKEALVNILLNALQAVDQNGKITVSSTLIHLNKTMVDYAFTSISGSGDSDVTSKVVMKKGTEAVRLEIQDDGPGIPEDLKTEIFNPFFSTKVEGTGLGLTTVVRTVYEHGGIIHVASKPNKGARFQIFLRTKN